MRVDLSSVLSSPQDFHFTLEPQWWDASEAGEYDKVLGLQSALQVDIRIYKAGVNYELEGRLKGVLRLMCDRCLEPYDFDIDSKFGCTLAPLATAYTESDIELDETDTGVEFVDSEQLDLADIAREQIFLLLPMKGLCREDCLGLCPQCGTDLNKHVCTCHIEKGHPEFLKLKNLPLKGE